MKEYSTRQAAKKLGITHAALSRYITAGKVPAPKIVSVGDFQVHAWTEEQLEKLRQLLPKIANGRKTRWKKKKAQAGAPQPRQAKRLSGAPMPVPHKKKSTKKKK